MQSSLGKRRTVLDQHWRTLAVNAVYEQYRQAGEQHWIAARGDSMRPLITPESRLLVAFGAQPRALGEIILFREGERLIAHRWVARRGTSFIAKGDAEAFCDAPFSAESILGVVRALRRNAEASASSLGCTGPLATAIARCSWWLGRSAAWARRVSLRSPTPLRFVAQCAAPLTRVVARVILQPIAWAAQINSIYEKSNGRG
jgi:hypothetical protein